MYLSSGLRIKDIIAQLIDETNLTGVKYCKLDYNHVSLSFLHFYKCRMKILRALFVNECFIFIQVN
jgi:hypothetical protein